MHPLLFAGTFTFTILRRLCSRRTLLLLFGLVACVYAVAALVHVRSMATLGLISAFDTVIKGQPQNVAPDGDHPLPHQNDRVLRVGDVPVHNWPDLLLAPQKLEERLAEWSGPWPPWVQQTTENGIPVTRILVEFQRALPAGQSRVFTAWCLLSQLPADVIVPALLWFCLKLLLFVVGVLVLWKRSDDAASVHFYLLCVVTLGAFIGGYLWGYIITSPLLLNGFICWAVLLPATTLHYYLIFPRPKLFLQRHPRWSLLAAYGIPLCMLAVLLYVYQHLRWAYQSQNIPAVDGWLDTLRSTSLLAMGLAAVWYLASVVALLHSYRTVTDLTERNQVKTILLGLVLAMFPIGYSLYLALCEPDVFIPGGAIWPMFAGSVCITGAFVVSFTRYRLLELDQLLSSGAVYFLISFLAGLVYYAVVFLGTLLFNQVAIGPSLSEPLTVSTTALLVLLGLDLARSRLMRALDRHFYREKYHLDQTLQRMGEALRQLVDPHMLVQRLLQSAADLLGIASGAVYLRQEGQNGFQLTASVGTRPWRPELTGNSPLLDRLHNGSALLARPRGGLLTTAELELGLLGGEAAQPLLHEGRLLGVMILGPRSGSAYRPEDLNLLGALTQITALAVESAAGHQAIESLNRDLQDKVEKIAEQQRRILVLQSQLRRLGSVRSTLTTPTPASQPASTAEATASDPGPVTPGRIVGSGPQVRQVLHLVRKVASTDAVVLIRGESGTGKELLAQAVHENSPRAGKPFVKVHCAALSANLLESELFGHVKGAFTGAHRDKMGRFELANGGTLFLDEIGDVSLEVQTKLLRVLQERVLERVGSSDPVKVDVRIITATHRNLEELIRHDRFREDLFYRLNVFPIQMPPLRERREDIPELAQHFLRQEAQRSGKPLLQLDDDALAALKAFSWPGNIRELENVLVRCAVLAEGPVITFDELPENIRLAVGPTLSPKEELWAEDIPVEELEQPALERLECEHRERDVILRALQAAGGNKAQAARALGLARSTLVSRLKKYGVL